MQKKKRWVRIIKVFHRIFVKKPKIVYLGEKIPAVSLILCNHVGISGPVVWELYMKDFRFWATHEITEGSAAIYKYLSDVFFTGKLHLNKAFSKAVSFVAAPIVSGYISGWELIPTYRDARLSKTIKMTIEVLKNNGSVLIFPENSSQGYHDELQSIFPGFCLAGEAALKKGINVEMVLAYLEKGRHRRLIIDKPVEFSKLKEHFGTRDGIVSFVHNRINELTQL